ncbi:type II toxin-antitoxin system RelE/ParE family toxin [Rhizobium sp. 18055]|uniref:type II toxin-antitoxin system RelE/ParE family toxin n=1 Tax=Rhizobium sp. 18055 TaxID=2681403 RepID=UPI00135BEFFF|nr:type II toxin-antitoxin system RelE/ParE family toxin [Rhizobium sp. 18055]
MPPIRYTRRALRSLRHIGEWIGRDNPTAARGVLVRLAAAIDLLCDQPDMGRPGRIKGTRELALADIPYIVAYRLNARHVEIIAVFHAAQRWPDRM